MQDDLDEFTHRDQHAEAQRSKPIQLADIAQAAGASPQSLQEGFRRFRSTTPMAFLRDLRLRGARGDLLDPAATASVTEIAMRWGFVHMGMFSGYYRTAFGESPSDTLARARRR